MADETITTADHGAFDRWADPRLQAGRVGRPHGLDGSFYVTDPRPRLLTVGTALTVAGASAPIVSRAGTDQRPIVRLDGIGDRRAAQALSGLALTVDRHQAPPLKEGEWWAHELEGCQVLDGDRFLGTVTRLIELPSCEALEVRQQSGEPLLVPMVTDAIRHIQASERRIEVNCEFLDLTEQPAQSTTAENAGDHGER